MFDKDLSLTLHINPMLQLSTGHQQLSNCTHWNYIYAAVTVVVVVVVVVERTD